LPSSAATPVGAVAAVGVERRLADLREANEQLVLAALDAQELRAVADRARQRQAAFMSAVAAELRNPQAPVRIASAMLGQAPGQEPLLSRVQQAVERRMARMARLVSDLVEAERRDPGGLVLARRRVDLAAAVDAAIALQRLTLDRRQLRLQWQRPTQPVEIDADPARLDQILTNLLDNACAHTPDGGQIAVSVSAGDDMVGDEGMVGVPLIMGAGSTPGRAVVHSAAAGYRIPGHLLQEEFVRSAAVLRILLRFTQALIAQMAQIAVCNRHHSVDQQLCRWLLLFELLRIPVARILSLIGGQRRGRRDGLAIPLIPAASTLRPVTAPVLVPARRRVRPPAAEVWRWLAVVAHGHAQDVHRHHLGPHPAPGSVVPGARVPVVSLEDPVQAVVEEVVRTQPRRVVHGVSRHECEARIRRQVDADAQAGNGDADPDADLGHRGRRRAPQHAG